MTGRTGRPPAADAEHEPLLSGLGSPLLLVLTGAGLLHVTVPTDVYLRYVKEGMWPYLVVCGVLLSVLGFAGLGIELARRWRETADDAIEGRDHHGHGHGHRGAEHVAWLLAAPALTLMFVAPPALGSYTASREGAASGVERTGYEDLADAPVTPMAMEEFIGRAVHAPKTLGGREVRLLGFVSAGKSPDTWYLNRLKLSCCAADARTLRVEVRGVKPPANDTWAEVTGVWRDEELAADNPVPAMEAGALKPVGQPRNPYHDAPPTHLPTQNEKQPKSPQVPAARPSRAAPDRIVPAGDRTAETRGVDIRGDEPARPAGGAAGPCPPPRGEDVPPLDGGLRECRPSVTVTST